ncbi:MAG: methyl-accepting chemotaxis protein, partial [Lachnospiraceae bacterium]
VVADEIRTLADQSRDSSAQISKIVNILIDNSNESVDVTQKVSEAFIRQNEKIRKTKDIFEKLNQEIMSVGASIDGISAEVSTVDRHKDVMREGIISLTKAAEGNTASAQEAANAMLGFEGLVSDCKRSTEQITAVTQSLVENIEKIGTTAESRKAMLESRIRG